jgi:putative SOS response-associated peptidase YedK
MINARAETVAEKPAFRAAFRERRCLIPADGFYEWESRRGSSKQPYLFEQPAGRLFAFAGLYEIWRPGGPDEVRTCTIITTRSNGVLEAVHDRMPVILAHADHAAWIDPANGDSESLQALLAAGPGAALVRTTVGLRVNGVRNDDAECAAPAPPQPRQKELW